MAPRFGTSGLRGLVRELTPGLVADHVRAFLAVCDTGPGVEVGWDLRPSSPAIADTVLQTLARAGVPATTLGPVPTPALALSATGRGRGAIMVTGSHIPADRNGLKFYTPAGEITKAHEAAILDRLGAPVPAPVPVPVPAVPDDRAGARWRDRIVAAFGPRALSGLRIGVHEQSSVARDLLAQALEAMGARTIRLGRSDSFVAVDTEAVDAGMRARHALWCRAHGLDALVSTDGDADRPLVVDGAGRPVPGDVLGPLTARMLGATILVTPVSSNSLAEALVAPSGGRVIRTRIGSPFVIAGMEAARAADPGARVLGYEANGGVLLGFEARGPAGPLGALMTRDSLLPIAAPLAAARAAGTGLSALVAALPPRFTATDRLQGIDPEAARACLDRLTRDAGARRALFGAAETGLDLTDGLRLSFGPRTVHLRPSGNAPEFRVLAEADSPEEARALVARTMERVAALLA